MSVEGGTTTYYAWDVGMTLAEYSPHNGNQLKWQKSLIYLGGRLLATESGAGTYQYHHPDRLGTRLIINSGGSIISEQIHLPYGTALSGESTNYGSPDNPSKKRFTSYERSDGTKLDHAVNRQYHAGLGRFTQVDPIGMSASSLSDPQSLNLYAYCGNDPINHTDPQGLFFKKLLRGLGKVFKGTAIAVFVAGAILLTGGGVAAVLGAGKVAEAFFEAFGALMGFFQKHKVLASVLGIGSAGGFLTPGTSGAATKVGSVSSFVAADETIMRAAPPDNSTWRTLFWEWLTGTGPQMREFGPDSKMTQELMTSPDIADHRKNYCAQLREPRKRIYRGGVRFGLGAKDGPWTAGGNMTRQFVGSFTLSIEGSSDGSAVFVAKNVTSRRSFFYHLPFGDWRDAKVGLGANKTQYFRWKEASPCNPVMRAAR
jgi:RHS repeat-associated protein